VTRWLRWGSLRDAAAVAALPRGLSAHVRKRWECPRCRVAMVVGLEQIREHLARFVEMMTWHTRMSSPNHCEVTASTPLASCQFAASAAAAAAANAAAKAEPPRGEGGEEGGAPQLERQSDGTWRRAEDARSGAAPAPPKRRRMGTSVNGKW